DGVRQQVAAHEGADVRHDPVLAGLDEEAVPERIEVLADGGHLLGDHPQQGLQRPTLLGVVDAVVTGETLVQALREVAGVVAAHGSRTPPRRRGRGGGPGGGWVGPPGTRAISVGRGRMPPGPWAGSAASRPIRRSRVMVTPRTPGTACTAAYTALRWMLSPNCSRSNAKYPGVPSGLTPGRSAACTRTSVAWRGKRSSMSTVSATSMSTGVKSRMRSGTLASRRLSRKLRSAPAIAGASASATRLAMATVSCT